MAHRIVRVDPGSPAWKAGLRAGDELKSVNGVPVLDLIDYQALTAESRLTLGTSKGDISLRKKEYEDPGLDFEKPLMSGVRMCCNHCVFCFVDQLPACARESLFVKDDDWRMSLMMGNYVTLTNVSDRELDRIIERRVSPLYISVHAMDPQLRSRIMGTPRAARLPGQLKRLAEGGIRFHAQAVLCPGRNDGEALERTIRELTDLYPACQSLALVPVGLTAHRKGLTPLAPYGAAEAAAVLDLAEKRRKECLEKLGTRFVFPSDEFYLAAGRPLPEDEDYEDYGQIDDGVGMLRLFETEYVGAWEETKIEPVRKVSPLIACGVSAAPFFSLLLDSHPVPGADVKVRAVRNRFFGESVTVSGLITGRDLVESLKNEEGSHILITRCMLREDDVFLDDMPRKEAEQLLGRPVIPVGRRGDELLDALIELVEGQNG